MHCLRLLVVAVWSDGGVEGVGVLMKDTSVCPEAVALIENKLSAVFQLAMLSIHNGTILVVAVVGCDVPVAAGCWMVGRTYTKHQLDLSIYR